MIIVPPKPNELDTVIYVPDKRIRRLRPGFKPEQYKLWEIDSDDWASPGLAFFGIAVPGGVYDYVQNQLIPSPAATYVPHKNQGLIARYNDVDFDLQVPIPRPIKYSSPDDIIVAFHGSKDNASAGNSYVCEFEDSSSTTRSLDIRWEFNSTDVTMSLGSTVGFPLVSPTGFGADIPGLFVGAFSMVSGDPSGEGFLNGVSVVTNSAASAWAGGQYDQITLGARANSTREFPGTIQLIAIWTKTKWSAEQHAAYAKNRFSVLKRKSAPNHTRNAHKSHAGYWIPIKEKSQLAKKLARKLKIDKQDSLGAKIYDGYIIEKAVDNHSLRGKFPNTTLFIDPPTVISDPKNGRVVHIDNSGTDQAIDTEIDPDFFDSWGRMFLILYYKMTTRGNYYAGVTGSEFAWKGSDATKDFFRANDEAGHGIAETSHGTNLNEWTVLMCGFDETASLNYIWNQNSNDIATAEWGGPNAGAGTFKLGGRGGSNGIAGDLAYAMFLNQKPNLAELKNLAKHPYSPFKLIRPQLTHSENIATIKAGFALPDSKYEMKRIKRPGKKPLGPVELNKKHWINNKNPIGMWFMVPGQELEDFAGKNPLAVILDNTFGVHEGKYAVQFDTTGDDNVILTGATLPAQTASGTSFTFIIRAKIKTGYISSDTLLGNRYQGTSSPLQFIKMDCSRFEYYNAGTDPFFNFTPVVDEWATYIVIKDGNTFTMYIDGVLQPGGPWTTTSNVDANPIYIGAGGNNGDSESEADVEFALVFGSAFTPTEVHKFSKHPYESLIPKH